MNYQPQNPAPTFESVWAALQENAQIIKENERERKEYEQQRKKELAEAERERKKYERERKKYEQEREEADQRRANEWERERADFWKSVKAVREEIGGITKSNGEVAEEYFVDCFSNSMQFAGQKFDSYTPNLYKKNATLNLQGEYDLVLYNCTSVVIIEIKYKARIGDIKALLKKTDTFKQLYPQYANFNFYLGLAAFRIRKDVADFSIKHGIAVIKRAGNMMVVNDGHLKVF